MPKWTIDPAHSSIEFSVRHMMITTVKGNFGKFRGTINFDPNQPEHASVDAVIDTASIDTGTDDRDAHLRSADFFEVDKYPEITFRSTNVQVENNNEAKITGDLTIHGVTRPVTLDVSYIGEQKNPFTGGLTVGFEASTKIDREDFGLTWNQALETGGVLVSKDIKISLDIQAIPVEEPASV